MKKENLEPKVQAKGEAVLLATVVGFVLILLTLAVPWRGTTSHIESGGRDLGVVHPLEAGAQIGALMVAVTTFFLYLRTRRPDDVSETSGVPDTKVLLGTLRRGLLRLSAATLLFFVLFSPQVEYVADTDASFHLLVEHLLLILGGVLTASGWAGVMTFVGVGKIRTSWLRSLYGVYLRVLTLNRGLNKKGALGLGFFASAATLWHLPTTFNLALAEDLVHIAMHVTFGLGGIVLFLTGRVLKRIWSMILLGGGMMAMRLGAYPFLLASQPLYDYPLPQLTTAGELLAILPALAMPAIVVYAIYVILGPPSEERQHTQLL